jgi:hypothetical protein
MTDEPDLQVLSVKLYQAWLAWDAMPGSFDTASRMEDVCQEVSAVLGKNVNHFREALALGRKDGLHYRDVIAREVGYTP